MIQSGRFREANVSQKETSRRAGLGRVVRKHSGSSAQGLARALVHRLSRAGRKLALAESCTGGLVGKIITDVPGASEVLLLGVVAYANEAKTRILGVEERILRKHGAVSRECARQMAEGARRVSGAHLAVSITGIAGPSGGGPGKPVGTVWFAVSDGGKTRTLKKIFAPRSRCFIRRQAARVAIWLALEAVTGRGKP